MTPVRLPIGLRRLAAAPRRFTVFGLVAITVAGLVLTLPKLTTSPLESRHGSTYRLSATGADFDVRDLPPLSSAPTRSRDSFGEHGAPRAPLQGEQSFAEIGSGVAEGPAAAPAPSPIESFEGLHYTESCTGGQCGQGHPPDTNGDVGPNHYIQTINTGIGIYNKSTGARIAAFTFDNFMSQGNFGNLCDTDNFGDPVVLYDTFVDRWIITDFAFQVDGSGNVVSPPGAYQCFAVSKNGDPVSGGWWFSSIHVTDGLQDYPKLGVWPDGIYMSANMFDFAASGSFQNVRVWAINKTQLYAGQAAQVVEFNAPQKTGPCTVFSLLPSNARAQVGTPPTGRPNLFASVYCYTARVRIWKFHVDWANTANSTFTGPTESTASTTWATAPAAVPALNGNAAETLATRLMMQNQYSNIGGVESLWNVHTVAGSGVGQASIRWYQVPVTGGTVGDPIQASTWNPDALNRFMPSIAIDRIGNMAVGYNVSSSAMYPAIRYAGRLVGDPVNTITQTEQTLINGTGSQSGNCGGSACQRWGDYSAMSLDPDGCTFWFTGEYYATTGLDHHTRIGSFSYPSCVNAPPPTTPPTNPPTNPPTVAPTSPPTIAPTLPPTSPPTSAPSAPPTAPPTGPPTSPPTAPPTAPPPTPNFTLSASPTTLSLKQGTSGTSTVTVTRTNFTTNVGLGVSGLPAGAVATFTPNPVSGTSTVLRITTSNCGTVTPRGTYHLTVVGTGGALTRTASLTLTVTNGPPTVKLPVSRLYANTTIASSTVRVQTSWAGTCDADGIASYALQRQVNGGSWASVTLGSATATSINQSLTKNSTYRFRLRATDKSGNISGYFYGPTFKVLVTDQTSSAVTWSGNWPTQTSISFLGGSARYATGAGAWSSYTFTGWSVGWVAYKGPTRGSARVYIDGVLVSTVSLYATTTTARPVVLVYNAATSGTHTIKIVVLGTAGHARIDVDAYPRLAPP